MSGRCNNNQSPDTCRKRTSTAKMLEKSEIFRDNTGKQWKLGDTVGQGGFGEIHLASCDNVNRAVKTDATYVAKIEDYTNGPLFVEINCYLRIAKQEMIEEWKRQKKLKQLGMPQYVAAGSHRLLDKNKLRFLILPRYKTDLEKILRTRKIFNLKTVLIISCQIIDVLEYIHGKGYIHSDIKASNILLGTFKSPEAVRRSRRGRVNKKITKTATAHHDLRRKNSNINYSDDYYAKCDDCHDDDDDDDYTNETQVNLLDFGLASKYLLSNGKHKEFCPDERKAHAGTILFCSRDAHDGVESRRSDLESLGYNIIYWLTGNLPWSNDVDRPDLVKKKKQKYNNNPIKLLTRCFRQYPNFLLQYFQHLNKLQYHEKPDYNYYKSLFKKTIKQYGYKDDYRFDFKNVEGDCDVVQNLQPRNSNIVQESTGTLLPLQSNIPIKPVLRRRKIENKKIIKCNPNMNWSKILIDDPEVILKQAREKMKSNENIGGDCCSGGGMSLINRNFDLNALNPTGAMIEVFNKYKEGKTNTSGNNNNNNCYLEYNNIISGYTPAMMLVYNKMQKRKLENKEINLLLENEYSKSGHNNINNNNNNRITRNLTVNKTSLRLLPKRRRSSIKSKPVVKKELKELRKVKNVPFKRTYTLRG